VSAGTARHPAPPGARGTAHTLVRVADRLRAFTEFVGRWGAVFILPLVFVTMWDVGFRKVGGVQYWLVTRFGRPFESTVLQELEWHFHTALFALVLGYAYVKNRHVRVDLFREHWSFRTQAWVEFLGCSFFMIPFCAITGYFALDFAVKAFTIGEQSVSLIGLPYRWIIKSVLVLGLGVALLAGVAVWLQTVVVLFGPRDLRFPLMTLEWPEDAARRSARLTPVAPGPASLGTPVDPRGGAT
jgi:TRAP-type mannitol/chloroaromatic compound transport system permease small subunit